MLKHFQFRISGFALFVVQSVIVVVAIAVIAQAEDLMPQWLKILLWISAAVVAIGIIWKKLVRPILDLIKLLDEGLPLFRSMAKHFKDSPNAFAQLDSILKEFGTDSGTTLRDVVDRLEKTAKDNSIAAEVLKRNLEIERRLTERRDSKIAELIESLDIVKAKQRENIGAVDRIEAGGKQVAQKLAQAQDRAASVEGGEAGAAADAAAKPESK